MFETNCHTYYDLNKNKHWLTHRTHVVLKIRNIVGAIERDSIERSAHGFSLFVFWEPGNDSPENFFSLFHFFELMTT